MGGRLRKVPLNCASKWPGQLSLSMDNHTLRFDLRPVKSVKTGLNDETFSPKTDGNDETIVCDTNVK